MAKVTEAIRVLTGGTWLKLAEGQAVLVQFVRWGKQGEFSKKAKRPKDPCIVLTNCQTGAEQALSDAIPLQTLEKLGEGLEDRYFWLRFEKEGKNKKGQRLKEYVVAEIPAAIAERFAGKPAPKDLEGFEK